MSLLSFIWNASAFSFLFCIISYLLIQLFIIFIGEKNLFKRYGGKSYALVTGGSSGIGRELAEKLAGQGFDVIIVGSNSKHLSETVEYIQQKHSSCNIVSLQADFSKDSENVVNGIMERIKDLDISVLAVNAGYGAFESAAYPSKASLEMLNANVATNLKLFYSVFPIIAKRGGEKNKKRGLVSFTSSSVSIMPTPFTTAYSSTKAYWDSFGEGLAAEADCYGVDVVVILPGPVSTNFNSRMPKLASLDLVSLLSQTPNTIASLILKAAGRFNVVDAGWLPVLSRIGLKVLDRKSVV